MEKIDSSEEDLSGIFFKNIEFKKCDFNKTCFDKSVFEKVSFDKSTFDRAKFMHAIFKQTVFMQSNLIESNFYQSCSEGLSFLNSNIEKTSFNNSKHRNFFIKEGLLEGACFLHAKVEKSEIQKCDLKNVLLADAKKGFVFKQCSENVFTKPVVALTWEFNSSGTFTPLIKKALEEQGALVMPFEYFPEDIDLQRLNEEMKQRIIELKALDEKMFFSRADEIVSQIKKGSEFQKILEKSQSVINHADALFLAGGDDVERVFYTKDTPLDFSDYRRTLLECMLLKQAREESKQVFGTCRRAQVTNVYYGGTIKTVGWQEGIKEFGYSAPPEYVTKVQKMIDHESLWGLSCHHQAIDEVGRGITVVVKDGEIPKLVIDDPKKGNVFLTQFHPEFYIEIPETRKLIEDSFEKYSAEEQAFYAPYLESVFSVLDNTERNKLFYKAFLDNVRMHATITA